MLLSLHRLTLLTLGLLLLAPSVSWAQSAAKRERDKRKEEEKKIKKEEKEEEDLEELLKNMKNSDFKREIRALEEIAADLAQIETESDAKKVVAKINRIFFKLPPLIKGSASEIDLWSKAQNRVSYHMWRLMKEPFFETAKMQAAWTLMSDPFSRPGLSKP